MKILYGFAFHHILQILYASSNLQAVCDLNLNFSSSSAESEDTFEDIRYNDGIKLNNSIILQVREKKINRLLVTSLSITFELS